MGGKHRFKALFSFILARNHSGAWPGCEHSMEDKEHRESVNIKIPVPISCNTRGAVQADERKLYNQNRM